MKLAFHSSVCVSVIRQFTIHLCDFFTLPFASLWVSEVSLGPSFLWHMTHCRWFNIIYATRLLRTHTYTVEQLNCTLFHVSIKRLMLHVWCHIPLIGRELLYNYLSSKTVTSAHVLRVFTFAIIGWKLFGNSRFLCTNLWDLEKISE